MADNEKRIDGRAVGDLRPVTISPDFVSSAAGSCLIEMGGTRVICTASIDDALPPWRVESGLGWVTAEYGMLPASTGQRKRRPLMKPDSRSIEIQRLIGRSLRSVVRFEGLGAHTLTVDCDVLEADGGTRTAAITGGYVALARAIRLGQQQGRFTTDALCGAVAAVSCGIVGGRALLDLCYAEDSTAEVDMNIVMTDAGEYIEIQGTSESRPFTGQQLQAMLDLARTGIGQLLDAQQTVIEQERTSS